MGPVAVMESSDDRTQDPGIEHLIARKRWREDWALVWVRLVERGARQFASAESERVATSPDWETLTLEERRAVEDHVARVFIALLDAAESFVPPDAR